MRIRDFRYQPEREKHFRSRRETSDYKGLAAFAEFLDEQDVADVRLQIPEESRL